MCSLERGRISDCSFLLGARFRKPAQNFEFLTIAPNLGTDNALRTRECKIKTLVFAAALIFSGKDREANSSMKLSLSIWQIFHHSEHFFKSTFQVDAYSSAGRVRENIRSMYCAASPRRNLCAIGPTMQRHVTQRRKRLWGSLSTAEPIDALCSMLRSFCNGFKMDVRKRYHSPR